MGDLTLARARNQNVVSTVPWPVLIPASSFIENEPPERQWSIEGLLPKGQAALLAAPGGTGKSHLLGQMGLSVATGWPLFGRIPVTQGKAVLLHAEENSDELHRRTHNAWIQMQQYVGAPSGGHENLLFGSLVGQDNLFTQNVMGEIHRTARVLQLVETLAKHKVELIAVDPVSRFRGGKENDSSDATRFIEACEFIAQETGAAVVLVHHFAKHADGATQAAARGSTAITDGVRIQLNLSPMTDEERKEYSVPIDNVHTYAKLAVVKSNYGEKPANVWLQRGIGGFLAAADLEEDREYTQVAHIVAHMNDNESAYSERQLFRDTEIEVPKRRIKRIIACGISLGELESSVEKTARGRKVDVYRPRGTRFPWQP